MAIRYDMNHSLIVVYTEDDNGVAIARRVANEHALSLLEIDQVVEECVKLAYDPRSKPTLQH